jgi:hypothetical protein
LPRGVIVPKSITLEQMTSAGALVSTIPVCVTAGNTFKISTCVSLTEPYRFYIHLLNLLNLKMVLIY